MTEPVVLIETPAPGVGLIRINRPDARNALNMEVRRRIVHALNEMTENAEFARSCLPAMRNHSRRAPTSRRWQAPAASK